MDDRLIHEIKAGKPVAGYSNQEFDKELKGVDHLFGLQEIALLTFKASAVKSASPHCR